MLSENKIQELKKEANTIFARINQVNKKLKEARHSSGDHWEDKTIKLELKAPDREKLEIELDLNKDAAENAEKRYEKAKKLEKKLERKKEIEGPLAEAPSDPVAYLILNHLKIFKGDYPRSMANNLNNKREKVVNQCEKLKDAGIIERIESGMIKRKKVKLKRSLETHQHHTYYRLSDKGDHLLRFLEQEKGKKSFLIKVKDALKIVKRISNGGPDYPRMTAKDLDKDLKAVRNLYKSLKLFGLVKKYEGSIIKQKERKLKPKKETHKKHTYYTTTNEADIILREL